MNESSSEDHPELGEHPSGTLAIVGVFGIVFFLGWLFFYFVLFAGRGAITH
ncbi:MAG: hypothetical protein LBG44_04770 [Gemmatimonadota bacterium]|nr:hypothetical protein [Gemmatimonadota bacterium]